MHSIWVLYFCLVLVTAIPLPDQDTEKRAFDCHDTSAEAVFDSSCWAQLQLTDFVNQWTPAQCPPDSTGKNCALPNEPWSTTFLRLAKGQAGYDCTSITLGSCHYDSDLNPDLDPKTKAQVRYVTYTIFMINTFFNDWFLSLQLALSQTSVTIQPLITKIDPIQTQAFGLEELLSAFSAGLAFIGTAIARDAFSTATTGALTTGVQQAPGVGKAIWPQGTTDSQQIQISEISTQLSSQVSKVSDRLNAGLFEVMSNQHSFAAFASSGAWSGQQKLTIPQDVKQMTIGLTTYIASIALTGNKFLGQIIPNNNPKVVVLDECTGNNAEGCYTNSTLAGGAHFVLVDTKHARDNTYDAFATSRPIIDEIIDSGWSTAEILFQGAFDCASSGHWGGDPVNVGADGTIDLSCVSQLDECFTSDQADAWDLKLLGANYPCVTNKVNGGCPVRNCRPEDMF